MISIPPFPELTPALLLRQAWRESPEPRFRPATVRLGWTPGVLHIVAELMDDAIFTRATGFNQRLWELGDTFEIFLRPVADEAYLEYHVAPGNHALQLCYPNADTIQAMRRGEDPRPTEAFMIAEPAFESATTEGEGRWSIEAQIPHPLVQAGTEWLFSFSRYDAFPNGEKPVVSSTSAHTILDFHDQTAWQRMVFTEQTLP